MRLQAREVVSYIVNRAVGLHFEDYARHISVQRVVENEVNSFGFPAMFDGKTPRPPWQFGRIRGRRVDEAEITHVDDHERFVSLLRGCVGPCYLGQIAVYAAPYSRVGAKYIDIPLVAAFVVPIELSNTLHLMYVLILLAFQFINTYEPRRRVRDELSNEAIEEIPPMSASSEGITTVRMVSCSRAIMSPCGRMKS
jgi:hypothetical protein